MRRPILTGFLAVAFALLAYNLVTMFQLPDEAQQGAIYRILFFHVPAAWVALLASAGGMAASLAFLRTRNLKHDSLAVAIIEVGLAFGIVNVLTGMIWARIIWGKWWVWDARLTSALVLLLLYAGNLMIRPAFDDPTTRARSSAALSVLAFANMPIVIFSIKWWRTQHPQPVVWGGGSIDPAMKSVLYLNLLPLLLLAVVLVLYRMRQEQVQQEIDSMRRLAHAH